MLYFVPDPQKVVGAVGNLADLEVVQAGIACQSSCAAAADGWDDASSCAAVGDTCHVSYAAGDEDIQSYFAVAVPWLGTALQSSR